MGSVDHNPNVTDAKNVPPRIFSLAVCYHTSSILDKKADVHVPLANKNTIERLAWGKTHHDERVLPHGTVAMNDHIITKNIFNNSPRIHTFTFQLLVHISPSAVVVIHRFSFTTFD